MSNFSFDGKRKNYCDYLDYKTGWGLPRELDITDIKGRTSGVLNDVTIKARDIEMTVLVDATYNTQSLYELADDFISWLTTDEPKVLIFDREPDKVYYAILAEQIDPEYFVTFGRVTVKMTCIDPYKYARVGSENTAISDQVSLMNSGTADTPILIEATALKPSSYFMIANGDKDYFMIGDDDVTKVSKDYMPILFHSEFQEFLGYSKMTSGDIPDRYLGGTVGGDFTIANIGDSFKATKFPDGDGWVGAGTKHSFPRSAQDFQITYKLLVEQKQNGAGHTAEFVYDTDNRLIASLGYENASASKKNGHIVMTLFKQDGTQAKIYDYPNDPKLYKVQRMVVYMRLKRVGNTFSIKTWKYDHVKDPQRTKPLDINEKVWIDKGNFYQRPIASMAVFTAKHGDTPFMEMNGLGSFNTEILPKPTGAKDMIIQKGDVVKVDTQNKTVVVNEEPMLAEKTFGSDFFNVESGYSELYVYPTKLFDTKVKWHDRYL